MLEPDGAGDLRLVVEDHVPELPSRAGFLECVCGALALAFEGEEALVPVGFEGPKELAVADAELGQLTGVVELDRADHDGATSTLPESGLREVSSAVRTSASGMRWETISRNPAGSP